MSEVKRVLIVGGGIAGMALAIALQRAGIAAEIAELDPGWRVYGAGITITGPTLRAFDHLGLLGRVQTKATATTRPASATSPAVSWWHRG
jgi:2-polyprenyl-6-methoxyphenol hydroxylase-like FAD-dependent oxidoreductase